MADPGPTSGWPPSRSRRAGRHRVGPWSRRSAVGHRRSWKSPLAEEFAQRRAGLEETGLDGADRDAKAGADLPDRLVAKVVPAGGPSPPRGEAGGRGPAVRAVASLGGRAAP